MTVFCSSGIGSTVFSVGFLVDSLVDFFFLLFTCKLLGIDYKKTPDKAVGTATVLAGVREKEVNDYAIA